MKWVGRGIHGTSMSWHRSRCVPLHAGVLGLLGLLGCACKGGSATDAGPDSSPDGGQHTTFDASGSSIDGSSADGGSDTQVDGGADGLELAYATYFGGTGWERIQSIAVDTADNIYVAGTTLSHDFPTTEGAYDRTSESGTNKDAFIARFNSDGALIWSTYLKGMARDDAYGVRVDSTGVYVVGWTGSSDFPTTAGAYDQTGNGQQDIFVAKLSLDGGSIVWSTLVGGDATDQARGAMVLLPGGQVAIAGHTQSSNFPTTGGAYQPAYQGDHDAVVFIVAADGGSLVASTHFGGSGREYAHSGIVRHPDGSLSIGGVTSSSDLPTTGGAFQPTYGGEEAGLYWVGDAYVARLAADLESLVFCTYVGGSKNDYGGGQNSLALHTSGDILLGGVTFSSDFPGTSGAFQEMLAGTADLFVVRVAADGGSLVAATYLGGNQENPDMYDENYESSGLVADAMGRILFGGWSRSTDFPVSLDAFQSENAGADDHVLSLLSADLSSLLYGTYLGGSSDVMVGEAGERNRVLALQSDGSIIMAGDTSSTDFPVTDDAHQSAHAGAGDAVLAIFR